MGIFSEYGYNRIQMTSKLIIKRIQPQTGNWFG